MIGPTISQGAYEVDWDFMDDMRALWRKLGKRLGLQHRVIV